MGSTLNLSDCLLAMGRELQEHGRSRDALKLFGRLNRFRDLPPHVAEETKARLAELFIGEKQYRKARRHLSVLMCMRPSVGKYFYQYAHALHRDPKADPARAIKFYQQALDLDPTQPRWWAGYGKVLVEVGRTDDAIGALEQAYQLAPDDPLVVGRLVEALCLADRAARARTLLRAARFAHPRDARFRKLWNDFQYGQIMASQKQPPAGEPVILPFVRRAALPPTVPPGSGAILRLDDARPAHGPHRQRRAARKEG
jgi:tetratricopeptide (TPR) repeat protein